MIRKIVGVKDPILRQKSKPILNIDKKAKQLASDLEDTLKIQKDPEGVGLAACQIGKSQRMFAMLDKGKIRIIANPEIIKIEKIRQVKAKKTGKKKGRTILEGCLSIPNYYGPLKRPQKLTLKYTDLSGQTNTEVFVGFSAQIVQHEVDHLNGILFTDKIVKQKKSLYKINPKTDEWEKVELL